MTKGSSVSLADGCPICKSKEWGGTMQEPEIVSLYYPGAGENELISKNTEIRISAACVGCGTMFEITGYRKEPATNKEIEEFRSGWVRSVVDHW